MPRHQVSVVIPTYNRTDLLARSIGSVLKQTYPAFEIIVVDDGSTDDTKQIVLRHYPSVRYVHQSNSGPATARNRGIREAKGDWVAFLDSDDEWFPQKLERQVDILKAHPSLRWCVTNDDTCSANGETRVATRLSKSDARLLAKVGYFPSFFEPWIRETLMNTSATLVRRDVFEEVGVFMPGLRHGEDTELWLRIAGRYPAIGYCVEPCLYRYLGSAHSSSRNVANLKDILRSLDGIMANAQSHPPPIQEKVLRWCRRRAFFALSHFVVGRPDARPDQLAEWHRWVPPGSWWYMVSRGIRYCPRPLRARVAGRVRAGVKYLESHC